MTNEEFVEFSNPHSWFLVADDLHNQVVELRKNHGSAHITRCVRSTNSSSSWDSTNRATFLLAAFTLENAIKAFLVYENPGWISNGKLSRRLRSHSLTDLASRSIHIPFKKKGLSILQAFEDGNISWARYPCSLDARDSRDPSILDEALWQGYLKLIMAYSRRLVLLLTKDWKGPHGVHASYSVHGEFLGVVH